MNEREALTAAVLAVVLCFAGIGSHHLWSPDEPTGAAVGRAMLDSGNLIVPQLNLRTGLLTVAVLGSTVLFVVEAQRVVVDPALAFFIALAHLGFVVLAEPRSPAERRSAVGLVALAVPLAFLSKGVVALGLAVAAPVCWLFATRRLRALQDLAPAALVGVLVFALVVGAWAAALYKAGGWPLGSAHPAQPSRYGRGLASPRLGCRPIRPLGAGIARRVGPSPRRDLAAGRIGLWARRLGRKLAHLAPSGPAAEAGSGFEPPFGMDRSPFPVPAYLLSKPSPESVYGIIGFDLGRRTLPLTTPEELRGYLDRQPCARIVLRGADAGALPLDLQRRLFIVYDERGRKASPFLIAGDSLCPAERIAAATAAR
jgi:hypothetical protein